MLLFAPEPGKLHDTLLLLTYFSEPDKYLRNDNALHSTLYYVLDTIYPIDSLVSMLFSIHHGTSIMGELIDLKRLFSFSSLAALREFIESIPFETWLSYLIWKYINPVSYAEVKAMISDKLIYLRYVENSKQDDGTKKSQLHAFLSGENLAEHIVHSIETAYSLIDLIHTRYRNDIVNKCKQINAWKQPSTGTLTVSVIDDTAFQRYQDLNEENLLVGMLYQTEDDKVRLVAEAIIDKQKMELFYYLHKNGPKTAQDLQVHYKVRLSDLNLILTPMCTAGLLNKTIRSRKIYYCANPEQMLVIPRFFYSLLGHVIDYKKPYDADVPD